jgi:urease accessory protein
MMMKVGTIMNHEQCPFPPPALLRLQSWLSPAFPTGSYSYSHGLEWAVEAAHIHDRKSLVDWLEADLRYGSGRNEAIFFSEAWRCALDDDRAKLFEIAELAAVFRGNSRWNHHSRRRPVSRRYAGYGLIPSWTGFRKYSANAMFSLP